jgi:sodium-dependent dicarboxylate transporter 2/3/5
MMMFPIALSVIHVMKDNTEGKGNMKHFSLAMMLSIAYASNFGGVATKIGTPPNTWFAGYYAGKYAPITFLEWMMLCMPVAIILLLSLYVMLTKILFRNHIRSGEVARNYINEEYRSLGPMSVAEKRVMAIFIATALLWILADPINKLQKYVVLNDTMIALLCAIVLFICPAGSLRHQSNSNESSEQDVHGPIQKKWRGVFCYYSEAGWHWQQDCKEQA